MMDKIVPLFWGERGDPNRRMIGSAEVDISTGEIKATVTDPIASQLMGGVNLHVSISNVMPPHTIYKQQKVSRDLGVDNSDLNAAITRLHGPGAVEAIEAAYNDGSIFNE